MKPFDLEACKADLKGIFQRIPYYVWDEAKVTRFAEAFKLYNEGEINLPELLSAIGEKRTFAQAHFGKYLNRELGWKIDVVEVTPRRDFKEPNHG